MRLQMMTHGPTSTPINQGRVSPYCLSHRPSHQREPASKKLNIFQQAYRNEEFNPGSFLQEKAEHQRLPDCNGGMTDQSGTINETLSSVSSDDLLLVEEHIRPLIKEELRLTIQSKRAARGLPETVELEYKKPHSDDVSPETLLKREKRRERNKVAAAKCRFKKKIVSEKLQEESEDLETANLKLKREIQRLEDERQKLVYLLELHKPTCITPDLYNDLFIQSEQEADDLSTRSSCNDYLLGTQSPRTWALSSMKKSNSFDDSFDISISGNSPIQRTMTQTC